MHQNEEVSSTVEVPMPDQEGTHTIGVDQGSPRLHAINESSVSPPTARPRRQYLRTDTSNAAKSELSVSETFSLIHESQMYKTQDALKKSLKHERSQRGGILFNDRVFTQEDWEAHVSFRHYLPEPIILLKVCYELVCPIAVVMVVVVLCNLYEDVARRAQPSWPSLHDLNANFAYSLCSFALSLLLIFKTNTSYARFWEAPTPQRKALLRWAIALPYIMRSHFLDYASGSEALEELLTGEELAWLRSEADRTTPHRPIKAVAVLMALLQQTSLPAVHAMDISNILKSYLDRVVTCERIRHTPIPMPYTRHTTRFVLVYTCFMPIVLWRNLQWGVYFVAPLITLLLAGIDNIGMHIENPLRILPMSAYCAVIHENLLVAAADWALDNNKDAYNLVAKSLSSRAPAWQQHAAGASASARLVSCGGSIGDIVEESMSPATYRLGRFPSLLHETTPH